MPTHVVNGIQLTYKNLDNGKSFETTQRFGDHQLIGYQDFYLSENEHIIKAEFRTGDTIDQLKFYTNKQRVISKGGNTGHPWPCSFEGKAVVGTFGGFGGHLHNIGFYVAPMEEIRFSKRKPYLLIRAWLQKHKESKDIIKDKKKRAYWSEIAFLLLVLEGKQLFVQVMRFV